MKNTNRKAFTIVELVIVIAIIAILAAVLIPTFINIVHMAQVSGDTQLVRNLNTVLATDGKEHPTMQSALDAAEAAGFDLTNINNNAASDNEIIWDSANDVFCYLIDSSEAVTKDNIQYIPKQQTKVSQDQVKLYQYWRITDNEELAGRDECSVYYTGTETEITTKVGFDVAWGTNVTLLKYERSGETEAHDVVIRTNSFDTTLTINDSSTQGKIYHYDNLGKLIITDCAMESYHEMGTVGYAELKNGHLAVEENASINLLFANSQDPATLKITNNGTITNAQAYSDSLKESATISGVDFNRDSAETVPEDDITNAVQETHQSNCEHANIEVTKEAKDPTCTETGLTAEESCADCHKVLIAQEVVSTIAHTLTHTAEKAVTCTEDGNVEYWTCSVCDKLFSDAEATQETTANDVKITATGNHTYVNHKCTVCNAPEEGWEQLVDKVDADGKIETEAFKDNTSITTIVIPDGVTEIGNAAFQGCTNLTSVTIPDSVTTIGDSAFYGCINLTTITIGKGVNSIKVGSGISDSFGRTKLTTITVDPENATYKSAGNALLNKNGTKLILGTASTVIPDTVTTIGNRAFLGREGLTTITIPANVTEIEEYAFSESSLTTIVIPSNVTLIGTCAFMSCKKLTTVTLNAKISLIAEGLFSQCSNLESITIPTGVTTIGGSAFYQCTKLTSITIPSSVTTIGMKAFLESGLTSADIGTLNWKVNGQGITNQLMTAGKLDLAKAAQCLKGPFLNSYYQPVDYSTGTWTR